MRTPVCGVGRVTSQADLVRRAVIQPIVEANATAAKTVEMTIDFPWNGWPRSRSTRQREERRQRVGDGEGRRDLPKFCAAARAPETLALGVDRARVRSAFLEQLLEPRGHATASPVRKRAKR